MKYLLAVIFIINLNQTKSQVVINEYSASNVSIAADNYGQFEDWIELYNTGTSSIDITGWYISDNSNKPYKDQIEGGVIPSGGYLKVFCSGRNEFSGGVLHTSFKLTQTKFEDIILSDQGGILIDQVQLIPAQENHSRGRTTDGASTWSVFDVPSFAAANNNAKTGYATTPQFNIPSGTQSNSISLTITSPDPSISIYYTLDGSTPTQSSSLVTGNISLSSTKVVRSRAFSSNANILPSFIETNTYLIGVSHSIKILSICGDKVGDLITDADPNAFSDNFRGAIELFSPAGTLLDEGMGHYNKHGNDSWFYDQRGLDFNMKDQFGYNNGLNNQIFKEKTRDNFKRIIIKAAANDNVAFETGGAHIRDAFVHSLSQKGDLKLDERTYEPSVLYVNGEYWGVYEIREKTTDSDFTDYYYGQDEKYSDSPEYIQYLRTWGGTLEMFGAPNAQNDWDNLVTYITSNNMANQANFNYVDSLLNLESLVDYFCINSYVVCADWLNWNTGWWRGLDPSGDKKKWRYTLWDMDATFGHYANYTGIPDQSANADPCDPEALPNPGDQGHTVILNALLENEDFYQYYVSRYIDLGNTVFNCDYMINHLDSLINLITPEMPGQIAKWGSSMATWNTNVQTLRDFITNRCTAIQSGMIDCYGLTGPYNITYDVSPASAGTIKANSIWLNQYPFTGTYYGGIDILLKAKAATGYIFDHWETTSSDSFSPNSDSSKASTQVTSSQTITAFFRSDGSDKLVNYEGIFLPSGFSPNGDGENDVLEIFFGNDVSTYWIQIYDRWGEMVFKSSNPNEFWDGSFNGVIVNSGVFVYELNTYYTDGTEKLSKGNITLVR